MGCKIVGYDRFVSHCFLTSPVSALSCSGSGLYHTVCIQLSYYFTQDDIHELPAGAAGQGVPGRSLPRRVCARGPLPQNRPTGGQDTGELRHLPVRH